MSQGQILHQQAMKLAGEAWVAHRAGDYNLFLQLTEQAFLKEKEAAQMLFHKFEAEPTRSILFRSAAQLAFNCGHIREAEQLIAAGLAGNPPAETLTELRALSKLILNAVGQAA